MTTDIPWVVSHANPLWRDRLKEIYVATREDPDMETFTPCDETVIFSVDLALYRIAYRNKQLPGIFPNEDGSIDLEWGCPEGVVSMECRPDGLFNCLAVTKSEIISVDGVDIEELSSFLLRVDSMIPTEVY